LNCPVFGFKDKHKLHDSLQSKTCRNFILAIGSIVRSLALLVELSLSKSFVVLHCWHDAALVGDEEFSGPPQSLGLVFLVNKMNALTR
jgi:hypothetical protein